VLEQVPESLIVHAPKLIVRLGYVKVDVAEVQADRLVCKGSYELGEEVEGDAVAPL